jgi:hypothetical protein
VAPHVIVVVAVKKVDGVQQRVRKYEAVFREREPRTPSYMHLKIIKE